MRVSTPRPSPSAQKESTATLAPTEQNRRLLAQPSSSRQVNALLFHLRAVVCLGKADLF